jgi:hypothetical protein
VNNEQEAFLEDIQDLVQIHPKIKKQQIAILDSINKDNQSYSVRFVIDYYSKQKENLNKDKLIINLSIGILLIGMGIIQQIWYASLLFYCIGMGGIVYSIFYYIEHKRNK